MYYITTYCNFSTFRQRDDNNIMLTQFPGFKRSQILVGAHIKYGFTIQILCQQQTFKVVLIKNIRTKRIGFFG